MEAQKRLKNAIDAKDVAELKAAIKQSEDVRAFVFRLLSPAQNGPTNPRNFGLGFCLELVSEPGKKQVWGLRGPAIPSLTTITYTIVSRRSAYIFLSMLRSWIKALM